MRIDHIAIWTNDLNRLTEFYARHFNCSIGERYENKSRNFTSCFLAFKDGARLEIMRQIDITGLSESERIGLAHFAIGFESIDQVDTITRKLEADGIVILSQPRFTGDGYYESIILDPDNNKIELTTPAKKTSLYDIDLTA
jgi:lactoylglutathione lyase